MNVFLKQIRPEHEVFRCRIEAGQRFTIGGSELANRRIRSSRPLPDVCVVLEVSDATCVLVNVAPGTVPVNVNGQPAHRAKLKNGDTIQIGSSAFNVTWKEEPVTSHADVITPVVLSCVQQFASSGLRQYVPGRESWSMPAILEQLCGKLTPILLFNAKAANIQFHDELKSLPDLYEHAPEEIRRMHSLQALFGQPLEELFKVYNTLHDRDAAVWAFIDGTPEAALKDAKLYVGWFARPSSLRLNLEKGSKMLLEGLMKPFAAICLRPQTGDDWTVYTKAETTWDTIGLEKPPANPR